METENSIIEYKSLLKIAKGDNGLTDLARSCVCLANSQGGLIYIGFDDKTKLPPVNQKITQDQVNNTITRLRSLCFNAAITSSEIQKHKNGGQFFTLNVIPSTKSIATTSDGKIFIRVGDECHPVRGEDLSHLVAEKDSFQWELVTSRNIKIADVNPSEINSFLSDIRASVKTTENIKNKTDIEILDVIERLITALEERSIDITRTYENWIKVGFALCTTFGERGRGYYHRIGRMYPHYTHEETDRTYTQLLAKNNGRTKLGTIIFLAKEVGVRI